MIFLAIGISAFIGILFLVIFFHGWQNKDHSTVLVSAIVVYMSLIAPAIFTIHTIIARF